MGGACGAPRLLGIYLISKMHTKTIQKIQKAYIKTYEEDVKIYKDIENSQGQGAFFENTGKTTAMILNRISVFLIFASVFKTKYLTKICPP